MLVVVGGLPGSGKTTVARGLSERAGTLVHSSDLVRRELQVPAAKRYTDRNLQRVYDVLLDRARAGLQQGWTVVLDASWTSAKRRAEAEQLAQQTSSPLLQLECRGQQTLSPTSGSRPATRTTLPSPTRPRGNECGPPWLRTTSRRRSTPTARPTQPWRTPSRRFDRWGCGPATRSGR